MQRAARPFAVSGAAEVSVARRSVVPETATVSLLREWSPERIAAQCAASYRAYHGVLRARHLSWAAAAPQRRTDRQPFVAESLDAALPAGWGPRLDPLLPSTVRHRHYLSAGSSQLLALAVLGPAAKRNDGLPWLLGADGLFPSIGEPVNWGFEYKVGFALLNEKPRTTDIDFVASGPLGVIAVEAKFMEEGMGACDCPGRAQGRCRQRVLDRPYWKIARDVFQLEGPSPGRPCELGVAYQAVRNVAAAVELTGLRTVSAFGLMYDERNPYFSGAGEWPGWANVLSQILRSRKRVIFGAISWQALIPRLASRGRREVLEWAREKHDLP
jgi:hypothetical protein